MAKPKPFDMERFFQALADHTRLRLLNLIAGHELCVCYLVEILAQPQPKISRHLAYLRSVGIVHARREGKWMHYRLEVPTHPGAAQILEQTLAWMATDPALKADRSRLAKACCSPSKYASLEGAPSPTPIACCEVC
ncbi:MAG: metalloregulator ArsR/SmtB family transcription factor [Acidobacteriota bacterium]